MILKIAESASCHLLERLAAKIAEGLLEGFPLERVRIAVSKQPDVLGLPEVLTVIIERARESEL